MIANCSRSEGAARTAPKSFPKSRLLDGSFCRFAIKSGQAATGPIPDLQREVPLCLGRARSGTRGGADLGPAPLPSARERTDRLPRH